MYTYILYIKIVKAWNEEVEILRKEENFKRRARKNLVIARISEEIIRRVRRVRKGKKNERKG